MPQVSISLIGQLIGVRHNLNLEHMYRQILANHIGPDITKPLIAQKSSESLEGLPAPNAAFHCTAGIDTYCYTAKRLKRKGKTGLLVDI